MAGLALVSVGLWTLRVALTARRQRLAGASVAALEASVFAVVFGSLVTDLDRPSRLVGYAGGVAIGTLLGIGADRRMAHGHSQVQVVVSGRDSVAVERLRARGWPATAVVADGIHGPVTLMFVAVDDACLPLLLDDVRGIAPGAFWTVEPIGPTSPVAMDGQFLQLRSGVGASSHEITAN